MQTPDIKFTIYRVHIAAARRIQQDYGRGPLQ